MPSSGQAYTFLALIRYLFTFFLTEIVFPSSLVEVSKSQKMLGPKKLWPENIVDPKKKFGSKKSWAKKKNLGH